MRRAFRGFLAVQDLRQRLTLRGIGALVDDGLHLALAFEDRPGPGVKQRALEPVELHRAEVAAFDSQHFEATAVAADRDREAGLRICPVTTIGGRDPAQQFNIEYRAADASANPYVAATAIIRAGLTGLLEKLPVPPIVAEHPEGLDAERRKAFGLRRLPETIAAALDALRGDPVVTGWFPPDLLMAFLGVRGAEIERVAGLSADDLFAIPGPLLRMPS